MSNKWKNFKREFVPYLVIPATFFLVGYLYASSSPKKINTSSVDETFFKTVEEKIQDFYPFKEPSKEKKIYGILQGLARSYGDDYTLFFPPKSSEVFNEDIKGSFGGIGAEVGVRDGILMIMGVLKGSPAEQAGLRAGDIVIKINDKELVNKSFLDALHEIRGEVGTKVKLTIFDPKTEETKEVDVTRAIIEIPTLETESFSDTFVIHLWNFNDKALPLFKEALQKYLKSGKKNLLIDLRGNPGGYLESAIDMLSHFIEQGKILVQEDFGDNASRYSGEEKEMRSKGYSFFSEKTFPEHIAVVIDSGSASASEIFAGALQDYKKAIVLGEKSFGKGSVQQLIPFENGSSLKVTIARWLTPKGRQISKKGIEPDFVIEKVDGLKTDELVKKFEEIISKKK